MLRAGKKGCLLVKIDQTVGGGREPPTTHRIALSVSVSGNVLEGLGVDIVAPS